MLGDIAYNARAGAEIVLHYLRDYGPWHAASTDSRAEPTTLVRVTYALYNGGPRTVARYRGARRKRAFQPVVDAFFEKYQAVRAGRELEVAQCWPAGG